MRCYKQHAHHELNGWFGFSSEMLHRQLLDVKIIQRFWMPSLAMASRLLQWWGRFKQDPRAFPKRQLEKEQEIRNPEKINVPFSKTLNFKILAYRLCLGTTQHQTILFFSPKRLSPASIMAAKNGRQLVKFILLGPDTWFSRTVVGTAFEKILECRGFHRH